MIQAVGTEPPNFSRKTRFTRRSIRNLVKRALRPCARAQHRKKTAAVGRAVTGRLFFFTRETAGGGGRPRRTRLLLLLLATDETGLRAIGGENNAEARATVPRVINTRISLLFIHGSVDFPPAITKLSLYEPTGGACANSGGSLKQIFTAPFLCLLPVSGRMAGWRSRDCEVYVLEIEFRSARVKVGLKAALLKLSQSICRAIQSDKERCWRIYE